MVFLKSIKLKQTLPLKNSFPFSVPWVRHFLEFEFDKAITFLVGENGSGKSTFIEFIAMSAGLPTVGSQMHITQDETLEHAKALSPFLRLSWVKRTRKGFFMRAEDFFGFIRTLRSHMQEMGDISDEYDERFSGYGKRLAKGMIEGQRQQMQSRYGDDLDTNSHGEAFLKLFQARFTPGGLYLLDEPETPLSVTRQLSFIAMINDMVIKGAQFIIVTHSPILMAMKNADIFSFDEDHITKVNYEELEQVQLTKAFLNNPENYLRRL